MPVDPENPNSAGAYLGTFAVGRNRYTVKFEIEGFDEWNWALHRKPELAEWFGPTSPLASVKFDHLLNEAPGAQQFMRTPKGDPKRPRLDRPGLDDLASHISSHLTGFRREHGIGLYGFVAQDKYLHRYYRYLLQKPAIRGFRWETLNIGTFYYILVVPE